MSTDFIPKNKRAQKLNMNVHGMGLLGDLHWTFGLPLDSFCVEMARKYGEADAFGSWRAPYVATEEEALRMANGIAMALLWIEEDDEYRFVAEEWRDFLTTCGGYTTL